MWMEGGEKQEVKRDGEGKGERRGERGRRRETVSMMLLWMEGGEKREVK